MLTIELKINDSCWGWIKLHRSPNSIWLNSEIELLQQISNQISLAIFYKTLMEENLEKEIQIKAETIANEAKTQILANASHGAIIGLISIFDFSTLTNNQKDMINIIQHTSDFVLSIVNEILNITKLDVHQITLVNSTFDLLDLFEKVIEQFTKDVENKQIELILNYDIENLPRYIKSDPERLKQVLFCLLLNSIKFTEADEIVVYVSIKLQKIIDDKESNTHSQAVKKECLLIELHDTGNGHQDSIGLGLSICKNIVTTNGGEFKAESQLGKGSKFWFTWNIDSSLLNNRFNSPISYILPSYIMLKRILVIHPVESARNAILRYLKMVKKVDAFDTPSKGIQEIKNYLELYNHSIYDIVFIRLYEKNKDEVMKVLLELREMDMYGNDLLIIFIVSSGNKGTILAENLISKDGGRVAVIYSSITWQKITTLLSNLRDDAVKNKT
ncbi:PAS domain S-box protein [Gigaspora margarita]|nr:PAS domain S-box protein [Gigaspora margarita]